MHFGYISSISKEQYEANKDQGYTMNDLYGQDGIEYVFEKYLRGKNGVKEIDMSVDGSIVDEYVEEEAIAGSNVVLTIDANLQAVAEKSLKETIENAGSIAKGSEDSDAGALVVMNVKTGEVLAMASYPSYDVGSWKDGRIDTETWNAYNSNENKKPLLNRTIAGTYSPGSTFKMVVATAALQNGKVTVNEKVNDTGIYPRGHNPKCWIYNSRHRGHGYLNITSAIKQSCNYFFYEMGYRTGIETIDDYAHRFGLGDLTEIELTGEKSGTVAGPELAKQKGYTWTVGRTLSAAIGQEGNSFTPMQLAKYISILVNHGKQVSPSIVKTIINSDGTEVAKEEIRNYSNERLGITPLQKEDIEISDENLKAIMEGMKGVTTEASGTAYLVFGHFNIKVAGKTGTAQTGAGDTSNALFAGFAPYDNPEIAVVCIIENGGGGSSIACYPARDVIAQYFGMNETETYEDNSAIPYTEIDN